MTRKSPEAVMAQWLIETIEGFGLLGDSPSPTWPVFYTRMPESPHKVVSVIGGPGLRDGRIMRSGAVVLHPSIQFMVRAGDADTAFDACQTIANAVDVLKNVDVVFSGNDFAYVVRAFSRRHQPIALLEDDKKRQRYVFNGYVTIEEVEVTPP